MIAAVAYKHFKVRRSEKEGRRDIWSTDGRNQEKGKKKPKEIAQKGRKERRKDTERSEARRGKRRWKGKEIWR